MLDLLQGQRGKAWIIDNAHSVRIRCPAHDERTPSCLINRRGDGTISAFCFGCKFQSDAIGLIGHVLGLTEFRDQLAEAARMAGIHIEGGESVEPRQRPERPPMPPEPPAVEPVDPDTFARIAGIILDASPLCSPSSAPVLAYLHERGLERLASDFGALPTSRSDLDALRDRIIREVSEDAWIRSGFAQAKHPDRWVWTDHRLIIPWRAPDGTVVSLQRRLIRPCSDLSVPKYVFPRGAKPQHLYGIADATEQGVDGPVVYVEGAVDTLALRAITRRAGIPATILGLPGIAAWSTQWASIASGHAAVIAFDVDSNGKARENVERIARVACEDLRAAGATSVGRWAPAQGSKDWGEMWQRLSLGQSTQGAQTADCGAA